MTRMPEKRSHCLDLQLRMIEFGKELQAAPIHEQLAFLPLFEKACLVPFLGVSPRGYLG